MIRLPYTSLLGVSSIVSSCSTVIHESSVSPISASKALWSASPKRPSRVNGLDNSVTICAWPTFSAPGAMIRSPPLRKVDGIDDMWVVGGVDL